MDENRDNRVVMERLADWVGQQVMGTVRVLAGLFWLVFGTIEALWVSFWKLIASISPADPFRLRVNGETLLSGHVKIVLGFLSLLVFAELAYEQFAWSSMWSYSLSGVLAFVISSAFTYLTLYITVAILTMDDTNKEQVRSAIRARLGSLMLIAMVTAIPAELRFFHSEIEKHISAKETAAVDVIREKAKAFEIAKADKRTATSEASLSGGDDDVVSRRTAERKDLVASQKSDRGEITKRLDGKSDDLAREIGAGSRSGRRGDGAVAAALRRQEREIREELKAFDEAARAQLKEFDETTEQMRTGAVSTATEERTRLATDLDDTLLRIEAMSPDELAANYGGDWKQSRGFMDELHAYLTILRQPDLDENGAVIDQWFTNNQKISAIVALMMVLFGLGIVIIKSYMISKPTKRYFSQIAQAHAGNVAAIEMMRGEAKEGDKDAIRVLRVLAPNNPTVAQDLRQLGYAVDGDVVLSEEVTELYRELWEAQSTLNDALCQFRIDFRNMCRYRTGGTSGHAQTRTDLIANARDAWIADVQPHITNLSAVEWKFREAGVKLAGWPRDFLESDPRTDRVRLWDLPDDKLISDYGWSTPEYESFRTAPTA